MHRSHFHSEANANKFIEDPYFDQPDPDLYEEDRGRLNEDDLGSPNDNNTEHSQNSPSPFNPFNSFYQSEDVWSSEQSRSHAKSHKKLGLGQHVFRERALKKVKSNQGDSKFLVINSKKQKQNNNYLFLSSTDAIRDEIKKYEISIEKLKD